MRSPPFLTSLTKAHTSSRQLSLSLSLAHSAHNSNTGTKRHELQTFVLIDNKCDDWAEILLRQKKPHDRANNCNVCSFQIGLLRPSHFQHIGKCCTLRSEHVETCAVPYRQNAGTCTCQDGTVRPCQIEMSVWWGNGNLAMLTKLSIASVSIA